MKITLVTNAATEQDYLDICLGRENISLCDDGRRQATKLKDKFKEKKFDYCYMSPLVRAVETAIILIGDRVLTIPDVRLISRDIGEYEGMPQKFYDLYKYCDLELNASDRGVEPIKDVFERCSEILSDIKERYKSKNILIVSDKLSIKILKYLLCEKNNFNEFINLDIGNLYCEDFVISE